MKRLKVTFLLSILLWGFVGCQEPVTEWGVESEYMVMTEYVLESDSSYKYTEFAKFLESADVFRVISTRGPFTLFLPTNDAMQKMYDRMDGVNSFEDIQDDTTFIKELVYNHIIGSSILSAEIGLGSLRETNELGDYIVSDFVGIDIRLNKQAIITDRDIELSNGYIHEIDDVIPIIDESVYATIKEMSSYSLFTQGLEVTGISDTLDIIEFPFGNLTARNRYTILAVADTTYNRYGIYTIDDLIAYYTDDAENVQSSDNEFYMYMDYHCLKKTYYLSDLFTGTYPLMSDENNIVMQITDDYKLNPDVYGIDYTGFNVPECNHPAKNGAIHTVDDLLPAVEAEPIEITWILIDELEITSGDWYKDRDVTGDSFNKWTDGENSFQNIKFEGSYLQYYYKDGNWTSNDPYTGCLNMIDYFWIEATSPKIMKGKYEITTQGRTDFDVYLDGKKVTTTYDASQSQLNRLNLGTHTFEETERHTVKIVARSPSLLFWVYVKFTPFN